MKRIISAAIACTLVASFVNAVAQTPIAAPAQSSTPRTVPHVANSVGEYQDKRAQLEAQIQIMKREAEVRSLRESLTGPLPSDALPEVVAVGGYEGALIARLLMPGGGIKLFRQGDSVYKDYKLTRLTSQEVVLSGPSHTPVSLPFVSSMRGQKDSSALTGLPIQAPLPIPAGVPAALSPPPPAIATPKYAPQASNAEASTSTMPAPSAPAAPAASPMNPNSSSTMGSPVIRPAAPNLPGTTQPASGGGIRINGQLLQQTTK